MPIVYANDFFLLMYISLYMSIYLSDKEQLQLMCFLFVGDGIDCHGTKKKIDLGERLSSDLSIITSITRYE